MFNYFIKRLFIFLPTLLVISWVAFGLSKLAPGDPVEKRLLTEEDETSYLSYEKMYKEMAKEMGMDRPGFYFNLTSTAYPDTLYKIAKYSKRNTLKKLIAQYGNWNNIDKYYKEITKVSELVSTLKGNDFEDKRIKYRRNLKQLFVHYSDNKISSKLEKLQQEVDLIPGESNAVDSSFNRLLEIPTQHLMASYEGVKNNATRNKLYVPIFRWNGFDNQYHNWASAFIQGDFGISTRDGQPVFQRLKTPMFWTFLMSVISLLIVFAIAVPLGILSAVKRNSLFDRITTFIVFIFYSLPSFWIATLLVVFFTTPEYGNWTDIFPSIGLGDLSSDAPFWDRFWERAGHLILPIFCLVYPGLAFISRQMRGGMIHVIQQDYIRTARAKGLEENTIVWKHAFRNALFPLITLFAVVFPSLMVGSVIIEYIFNIPGMGRITLESISNEDWPIVFTVLMLVALLTLIGNFIADIFYAMADPRISFQ